MAAPATSAARRVVPGAPEPLDEALLRREVFNAFLLNPPQDDAELHLWIRAMLGFNIPSRNACPEHQAPFAFVADQFFERTASAFGFANRSGGKTRDVAVLNLLDALFKEGIEIVLAGAVKEQADRGFQYLVEMMEHLIETMKLRPGELVNSYNRAGTVLFNKSKIIIVTASYAGLNGPHPNKLRLDEVELIWHKHIEEALSMSQEMNGYRAQDTFTSTRKVAKGSVQRLLDEAEQRNLKIYKWCIFDVLERCARQCKNDPVYGNCGAYSRLDRNGKEEMLCGGRARELPPGGYYSIDDFVKKVAMLDRDTWKTQWLNDKPSGGALVFGDFYTDEAPFLVDSKEAAELLERAKQPHANWPRVIGIDFGSNFAVEFLMQDPVTSTWYNYFEIFWTPDIDLPLKERAQMIKARDPLGWSPRAMVFADPSGKQAITDLASFGVDALPASNDVYAGIQHLKGLLDRKPGQMPKLRVFHNCKELRKELGETYLNVTDKDGTLNKDKILKEHDHAVDALRYGLFSFSTVLGPGYKLKKLRNYW